MSVVASFGICRYSIDDVASERIREALQRENDVSRHGRNQPEPASNLCQARTLRCDPRHVPVRSSPVLMDHERARGQLEHGGELRAILETPRNALHVTCERAALEIE